MSLIDPDMEKTDDMQGWWRRKKKK